MSPSPNAHYTPIALHVLGRAVLPNVPSAVKTAILCLGVSWGMVLLAKVSFVLPFTPVPITGQTLGVLLAGMALGPGRAGCALGLYLLQGAVGLPMFTPTTPLGLAAFVGPTGGYLLSYVPASMLVGWLALRGWDRHILGTMAAMLLGSAVIYAFGLAGLALWLNAAGKWSGVYHLLSAGMLPFLLGDTLKAGIAIVLLPGAWAWLERTSTKG